MRLTPRAFAFLLLTLSLCLLPGTAEAHTEAGAAGGLVSGFIHPLTGLDHIVAMVAVGLWGAYLGAPAIWMLPIVFPMVMAIGGGLGVMGIPVPYVETGIALSAIVLGAMVALAAKPKLWIAAVLVGLFAIFHGYAHGKEMPNSANAFSYAAGFVVATGLLHLSGIGLGFLVRWPWGRVTVRTAGVVISGIGVAFLVGYL